VTVDDLATLFEGRTRFVERLAHELARAGAAADAFAIARSLLPAIPEDERLEALNAHPVIGAAAQGLSATSAREQGRDGAPEVLADLAHLNRVYEDKFGFRFVVFVNGRPKAEILDVLRVRIMRTRSEELSTAMGELVSIAHDRFVRRGV
jgi:2-oxo-4-hydroxy-4-carboxy--5-ureidoimidazoline (OHCU) decarboxylase